MKKLKPKILGRNDPCWCGSGMKYKKCHLESDAKKTKRPGPGSKSHINHLRGF
jgi:hypothetical protein